MNEQRIPPWEFYRRRDIERAGSFMLAGNLLIELPKKKRRLKRSHVGVVDAVINQLLALLKSGDLPEYAVTYGWNHGSCPPSNDDAIMADWMNSEVGLAWAKRSMKIAIRVDRRNDVLRIDNVTARELLAGRPDEEAFAEFEAKMVEETRQRKIKN
jgi:hypothetical protein